MAKGGKVKKAAGEGDEKEKKPKTGKKTRRTADEVSLAGEEGQSAPTVPELATHYTGP